MHFKHNNISSKICCVLCCMYINISHQVSTPPQEKGSPHTQVHPNSPQRIWVGMFNKNIVVWSLLAKDRSKFQQVFIRELHKVWRRKCVMSIFLELDYVENFFLELYSWRKARISKILSPSKVIYKVLLHELWKNPYKRTTRDFTSRLHISHGLWTLLHNIPYYPYPYVKSPSKHS